MVLLHGLARTSDSFSALSSYLESAGYQVVNYDYPSRKHPISILSEQVIPETVQRCRQKKSIVTIHFVTHSLGGILVRYYLSTQHIPDLGRVVMLSPPNGGSEVVDRLAGMPGFSFINGPAGFQLGTGSNSIPLSLGPASFNLGIITGNSSINLILSTLIPGPDDGKVSVARAQLQGMQDFIVLPYSHTFIMQRQAVFKQIVYFLQHGQFLHQQLTEDAPLSD